MSANGDDDEQGGAGRREVAWRVFAAEYDDADLDYSESDEERAPNYVVTPTGARVNRLFAVGVLTEIEQVSDDVLRGRVVDPTGAFVLYAGQYQPDEMAFLERADPPTFVAVTGKARTFQPEDSDRVFTSIRPESINEVDAETRDRWTVQTAEQTLARVSAFADALDSGERGEDLRAALEAGGADAGLAAGIGLALDHYGTTRGYLAAVRDLAIDATRVVADELDADDVGALDLAPDEGGSAADATLDYSPAGVEVDAAASASEGSAETAASDDLGDAPTGTVGDAESAPESDDEADPDIEAEPEAEDASEPESESDLGDAPEPEVEAGGGPETDAEAVSEADPEADSEEPPEVEDAEDAAELQEEVGTDEPPEVETEQSGTTDDEFEPESDGDDDPDLGTAGAGDEMYEFDDEEREQVEEEYGLEFSSGSEVDSPEESEMDPPEPDPEAGPDESTPERESELADESPNAGEHAEPTAEAVDADELQDVESAQGGTESAVNADDQSPAGGETAAAEAPGASVGEDESSAAESEASSEGGETPDDLEDAVMDRMQELDEGDGVEREALLAAVVQQYDVTPADVDDAVEAALMDGRCYESGEDTLKPI